jgi:hypothetical protein
MFVLRDRAETYCSNCKAAEFIGTLLEHLREFPYSFKENWVNFSSYSGSGTRLFPRVPKVWWFAIHQSYFSKKPLNFCSEESKQVFYYCSLNPIYYSCWLISTDFEIPIQKRDIVAQVFWFVPNISHCSEDEDKIRRVLIRCGIEKSWYKFGQCCKNGRKVFRLARMTWSRDLRPYLWLSQWFTKSFGELRGRSLMLVHSMCGRTL